MKHITKHILFAALFTSTVWSAPKPADQESGKPTLIIAPFTMKSSDEKFEIRMDEKGKIFAEGKHFATAHAEGTLTSSEGELLIKLNQKGMIENGQGEITEVGTLKLPGANNLKWIDGKFDFGDGNRLTLEPKDSPAMRTATLCVVGLVMGGIDNGLMIIEEGFGPYTLRMQPAPKESRKEQTGDGTILLVKDKNTFELVGGEFRFNGKNYGELPEGSVISLKEGVLTINGKAPAEPKK